jgi:hypothetical protein
MMKTLGWMKSLGSLALCLSLVTSPLAARPSRQTPVRVPPTKDMVLPAEAMKTVTGIIKGAPAGKIYTVVSGKRSVSVDAGKAVVRNKGRFAATADLKPGTFIRATGSMNGPTLVAKTVDIVRSAGGKSKKK